MLTRWPRAEARGAQSLQVPEKLGAELRAKPVTEPRERSVQEMPFEWGFVKALVRTRVSVELIWHHE
jgi:hypothetical protein